MLSKIFIAITLLFGLFCTVTLTKSLENVQGYTFRKYIRDFKKQYPNVDDMSLHSKIFEASIEQVKKHNNDPANTWKMGINKFSDMTAEEKILFLGHNSAMAVARRGLMPVTRMKKIALKDLPTAIDWRDQGVVSAVKDQGGCGSCWAFAAVEAVESSVTINTGVNLTLSPQNYVDCVMNPDHCGGTGGCTGATSELAFNYTVSNGLASEDDYPYAGSSDDCKADTKKSATIAGFVKIPENNYQSVMTAVATVGPPVISVDAMPWFSYSSGVFTGCQAAGQNVDINHAVQLVGYGTDDSDFWIVRNSWGDSWGESGYIRIARDPHAPCNTDPTPKDGTGCDGGPPQVTVCGECGLWYDVSYPTGGAPL